MTGRPPHSPRLTAGQALHRAMLLLVFLAAAPFALHAQTLTAEQQRLLNQLPPSQRDAAMRQLRQFTQQAQSQAPREAETDTDTADDEDTGAEPPAPDIERVPQFRPGDTVVIVAAALDEEQALDADARRVRETLIDNLRQRNPYILDDLGRLELPGVPPVNLAGLTEEQATLRLLSEPTLKGIAATVTRLPLADVGVKALKPFGYDIFSEDRLRGRDTRAMPVPADYVIGPGDVVKVQLFGTRNAIYELPVERDGRIVLPEVGPVTAGGLSFAELRNAVKQRVEAQLIGTQASVTLGDLRSIQVFLVGDVSSPGSYTVGSLSTITTVLTVGGGVAPQGSLRNIQHKRGGTVLQTLDLYDLLLRGDTSRDARVQEGDVVFVPPIGSRVAVAGEVKRPAIYEYRGAANVADIIALAGGLLPTAYSAGVRIERIDTDDGFRTVNVDLGDAASRTVKVADGDTIRIPATIQELGTSVSVVGNVFRPGPHEWRPGLRLSTVIESSRAVKPGSDLNYVLIRREPVPNGKPVVLSADLEAAWRMRGGPVDLELEPRDTIYVFDLEVGRGHIVQPILEEMRLQSSSDAPLPVVAVGGSINAPGEFPLEGGMRIGDLVRAGGGLSQSAFTGEAELTRYVVNGDGERSTELTSVDLAAALAGDSAANVVLQPFDYLNIREIPNWRAQKFVRILGEVRFPGRYPVKDGESLLSVIRRAGGITDLAYPAGSVFTREVLREREREQLRDLAFRIERDLASLSLSDPGQSEALGIGQTLLSQLRTAEPAGRLVINLENILSGADGAGLMVEDGDTLRVRPLPQEVTVIGEVQYATSHVFTPGFSRDDYIERSGGTTARADRKRIYIVRASGEVVTNSNSRFFASADRTEIRAGDTIVVPIEVDRIRPLTLWTNVTQILYNLAIAAAAANSF